MTTDNNNSINHIIGKLNFDENTVFKKDFKEGVYAAKGTIDDKTILLKILSKKNPAKTKNFYKEALVGDLISKHNLNSSSGFIPAVTVLQQGENDDFIWLVRQYYDGQPLGDVSNSSETALYKHDNLNHKYVAHAEAIIHKILIGLGEFQGLLKEIIGLKAEEAQLFQCRFPTEMDGDRVKRIEELLGHKLDKQVAFYNQVRGEYLCSRSLAVSMGDLVPTNIIMSEDDSPILTDLEWLSLDNCMVDVSFLWLFLWRYPDWQNQVIKQAVQSERDKDFFRASVIRQITSSGFIRNLIVGDKPHKWIDYLDASGESFDALISRK